jgi:hypothetical protein
VGIRKNLEGKGKGKRWATGWTIGVLGLDSRRGRPERLWGPPSLLSNGYQEGLSLGAKRPGREADHSPPSSAEVKNAWSYTSTPPLHLHGVELS